MGTTLKIKDREMSKSESDDPVEVMSVPEAGKKLGLGRNAAYDAAGRGEIPSIRLGRLLKVPKVAFQRMLEQPGRKTG
jgi:excisionase family DNA binding protein